MYTASLCVCIYVYFLLNEPHLIHVESHPPRISRDAVKRLSFNFPMSSICLVACIHTMVLTMPSNQPYLYDFYGHAI